MSDNDHHLEGSLPPAALDDPHLLPATKNPERMEALAAAAIVVGMLGFIAFIWAYWVNANTQWQAATLAVGMLGLGVGTIAWGKYLMPQGPFVEERHDFRSSDAERELFNAAITGRGGLEVKRRGLLLGWTPARLSRARGLSRCDQRQTSVCRRYCHVELGSPNGGFRLRPGRSSSSHVGAPQAEIERFPCHQRAQCASPGRSEVVGAEHGTGDRRNHVLREQQAEDVVPRGAVG